jgi:hypothetical protein
VRRLVFCPPETGPAFPGSGASKPQAYRPLAPGNGPGNRGAKGGLRVKITRLFYEASKVPGRPKNFVVHHRTTEPQGLLYLVSSQVSPPRALGPHCAVKQPCSRWAEPGRGHGGGGSSCSMGPARRRQGSG